MNTLVTPSVDVGSIRYQPAFSPEEPQVVLEMYAQAFLESVEANVSSTHLLFKVMVVWLN